MLHRALRQRRLAARMPSAGRRRSCVEQRPRADRRRPRRPPRGDRLHLRRDRDQQPGDQGRRLAARATAATTSSPCATEHKAVLDPCERARPHEGFAVTVLPVDGHGPGRRPSRWRRALEPRHHPRLGDARQQRDRHAPADRRDRADLPRAGRALPQRRHAGGRQDPDRRRGAGRRPAVLLGPQDVRAEGRRGALRASARRRACASSRWSTAAGTSRGCAAARSTCPASSGSPGRSSSASPT